MEEMLVLQGSSAAFLSSFDDLPKIIPWHFLFMVLINLAGGQRFYKVTITLLEVLSLPHPPPSSNKRKYISTGPLLKNG